MKKVNEEYILRILDNLQYISVIIASLFLVFGGVLYLVYHGKEVPQHIYSDGAQEFYGFKSIFKQLSHEYSLIIIQIGVFLIIITPLLRVLSCFGTFVVERDYLYMSISGFVILTLLFTLI